MRTLLGRRSRNAGEKEVGLAGAGWLAYASAIRIAAHQQLMGESCGW